MVLHSPSPHFGKALLQRKTHPPVLDMSIDTVATGARRLQKIARDARRVPNARLHLSSSNPPSLPRAADSGLQGKFRRASQKVDPRSSTKLKVASNPRVIIINHRPHAAGGDAARTAKRAALEPRPDACHRCLFVGDRRLARARDRAKQRTAFLCLFSDLLSDRENSNKQKENTSFGQIKQRKRIPEPSSPTSN